MDLIKLPIALGCLVVNILQDKGIKPRTGKNGLCTFEYTQDELNLITELNINNPTFNCLDGIENLHNLEKLSISSSENSEYKLDNASISDKDIARISKLTKLKSLKLDNQAKISWVNLDHLINLENVEITRNPYLEEIAGLENLKKLNKFVEYGNIRLFNIDNLNLMLQQNNLELFMSDLLHFPDVIQSRDKLEDIASCYFVETFGDKKLIKYSCYELSLFHIRCYSVAERAAKFSYNKFDQITFVDEYLAKNIKYDYSGVDSDNRAHYDSNGKQKGKSGGTNSAYNGVMYGCAVCEGYTRSMQYILKLLGIKTKQVRCIGGKNRISINEHYHNQIELPNDDYHSIIRIDENNSIYYCDPCWDSCNWHRGKTTLPYCLLTQEEMSENHTLSFDEDEVTYDIKYPRYYISSVLDNIKYMENSNNIIESNFKSK